MREILKNLDRWPKNPNKLYILSKPFYIWFDNQSNLLLVALRYVWRLPINFTIVRTYHLFDC